MMLRTIYWPNVLFYIIIEFMHESRLFNVDSESLGYGVAVVAQQNTEWRCPNREIAS